VGKYTADIEIAVRGGRELAAASQQVAALSKSIATVNKVAQLRGSIPASINNYQVAVQRADTAVRQSVAGTRLQKQAIDVYVKSLYQAEQAEKQLTSAIAKRQKELNISTPKLTARSGGGGGGVGKAIGGSLSSAAIGGAFPLLFGQSPQAAVGGAIGGLLGGAGGGFAGSLLGTALGELEAAKARTKELAVELGLTSTQAKTLATAFELAGRNSQQLEAAVTNIQGLGLSTQETSSAIKIAVELSKEYGGSVEKIAQAFADTLESGKVSVSTLNKFTAQGIPIQDQLAEKLGVSRTKLLEMAKDGKISVQQVTDVLVDMGQEAEKTADKGKTGFDRFVKAVEGIATAIASAAGALLKTLVPALDTVLTKLSNIITRATQAINLLTDAQVGEASAALARSGMSRGTLFANRGNIDDLTQGLKSLQPLSAKTTEQFDRIADTAQRYRVELSKYGGSLGEYAVGTAQVELTRVTKDLAAARKAVGAPARPDAITGINAPANLPPSGAGAGKSAADKAANDAAREAARVAEIVRARQLATLELQRQAVFSQKIAEAEMAKDPIVARQLQGQQEIMQLGIKIASELEKEKNTTAQLVMAREFQAKKALALLGIEIDIAKITQQQKEQYDTIISDLDTELALKYAITEQERTQLRIAAEMRKLQLSDPSLTEPKLLQIQQAKERLAAPKTGRELVLERTGALEDELKSLTDVGNVAITVAAGIGDAFGTSFKGIISGSMTAKEALANFFTSVADMFLDMAAQIITKMITMSILNAVLGVLPGGGGGGGFGAAGAGFGGSNAFGSFGAGGGLAFGGGLNLMARANGGPVSSGQTYMVGERGPELFVPGRSGTIVANDKMGGGNTNVVVNVDAKGSSVEGDEQGANQLGRVISAAVQSELIKQQRPGGILAR
jgi:tape measure domain-containing protein